MAKITIGDALREKFTKEYTATKVRLFAISTEVHPGHLCVIFEGAEPVLLENAEAQELAEMIRATPLPPSDVVLDVGTKVPCRGTIVD